MGMIKLAIKMLIGNKASCLGVIFGIFLATLLISQQSAIFLGLISRSYRIADDIPYPNVWVIDPVTQSDHKARGMPDGYLDIIRSIDQIEWAVPINVLDTPIATRSGIFDIAQLYGIDVTSLIGVPNEIVEGNVRDLRNEGAVIIDDYSANELLAQKLPDGTRKPLQVGDSLEINNRRATIVGKCKIKQGFYPQPIIFTSFTNFKNFTGMPTSSIQFIAARTTPKADVDKVVEMINSYSFLNGLTRDQLKWRIAKSFLQTGILINFGLSVALGIIIGFSISGQIFYIMTLQNLPYFALIKAIGGNESMISKMIVVQVFLVGILGFLLGTGATLLWGIMIENTTLAFLFPWELLIFSMIIVLIICLFTAGLSIRKVFSTDPKILMGS